MNFFPDRFCASICTPVGLCVSGAREGEGRGKRGESLSESLSGRGKTRKNAEREIESR